MSADVHAGSAANQPVAIIRWPVKLFVACALIFGLVMVFLVPPFQAPDEHSHFYRICQISEGIFTPVIEDGRVGGSLPVSIRQLVVTTKGIPFHPDEKMTRERIHRAWSLRLDAGKRAFVDFNNTALTSFVPYLHQAAAVWLARQVSDRTVWMVYAARLANLLVWILLVACALHYAPGIGWLILLVAFLPTGFSLAASMSYDVLTNAVSCLLVAVVYRISGHAALPVSARAIAGVWVLAMLLASAKLAYVPLVALLLFVPVARFGSWREKGRVCLLVMIPALLVWLFWMMQASALYLGHAEYNPLYRHRAALVNGADAHAQFAWMLAHPFAAARTILSVVADPFVYESLIAVTGWVDTYYPGWFVITWWVLLLLVAMRSPGWSAVPLDRCMRVGMVTTAVLSALLFVVLLYMNWSPVGSRAVLGMHGRYWLPCLLPALIAFAPAIRAARPRTAIIPRCLPVWICISSALMLIIIFRRYYSA